jgi:hypothetical protein
MLKWGIDYLAFQLAIVLRRQGVDAKKVEGSPFSYRIKFARQLTSPAVGSAVLELLESLSKLYKKSHDPTLVTFAHEEWRNQIEQDMPPGPPNLPLSDGDMLRYRVYLGMYSCVIALDNLGGNTRLSPR